MKIKYLLLTLMTVISVSFAFSCSSLETDEPDTEQAGDKDDDNTGEELESGEVEVPGTAVDTIWVARGYEFTYCDYFPDRTDLSDAPVRLTISNAASRSDSKYTRTLNIDCIILKPSNENAGNEE